MKKVFTLLSLLFAMTASVWADPGDVVTDLSQLSTSKTFVIEAKRGRIVATAGGTSNLATKDEANGTPNDNADNDNDEQRFFIFRGSKDNVEGVYIYSVAAQKFLVAHKDENGLYLSDTPLLLQINDEFTSPGALNINPNYSNPATDGNATEEFRWVLAAFLDTDQYKWLNCGGGNWKFDDWSRPDNGNRLRFIETETKDTDPQNPEDLLGSTRPVKAFLSYNGTPWKETVDELVMGSKLNVPNGIANPLLAYAQPKLEGGEDWRWFDGDDPTVPTTRQYWYDPDDEENDTLYVYYDSSWGAPFELSTSYSDAKWYTMDIRRSNNQENFKYIAYDANAERYPCTQVQNEKDLKFPAYHWALIGDPINGIKIINRAAGEGKYLQPVDGAGVENDGNILVLEGEWIWEVTGVSEGTFPAAISISVPGTNKFANDNGGYLRIWNDGGARQDAGSLLRFTEAPESETALTTVTLNATYNGQTVKTATVQAFVETPLEEVIPGSGIDNGLVDFDYDPTATVTADMVLDVPVSFKLPIDLNKNSWYNLTIREQYYVNALPQGDKGNYHKVAEMADADLDSAPFQWAFEGNPYQVKVYNRAYGEKNLARFIDPDSNIDYAAMRDTVYYWDLYANPGESPDAEYGFTLAATDAQAQYINDNNRNLRFWNDIKDKGSRFIAYEVLAVADPMKDMIVNYHLNYEGKEVKKVSTVAFAGDYIEMPESFNNPLLNIDFDAKDAGGEVVETIPSDADTFDVYYSAVWAEVFELSTSFADAKWYNMDIRRSEAENKGGYIYVSYGGNAPYSCNTVVTEEEDEFGIPSYIEDTDKLAMTNYQWALIGDPFQGVQLINRAAGEGQTLGVNANNVPEFVDSIYTWDIIGVDKNDGLDIGFALKAPGTNNWLNHSQGNNTLILWVNGSGTDNGSILRFSEVPESSKKQAEFTFNAVYNGETIKTAKFYAFEGDKLGEALTLPADWNNGLVEFDYNKDQTITDGMTVNANVTLTYDIDLTGGTWYNLEVRDNYWVNTERVNGDGHYMPEDKANVDDEVLKSKAYLWAFVGNPYQFKIYNAALNGTLANQPVNDHPWAVVQWGVQYVWNAYGFTETVTDDETGEETTSTVAFGIEYSDKLGNYINQEGGSGNNRPLGSFTSKFDGGSKLRAYAQDVEIDDYDFSGVAGVKVAQPVVEAIYNMNGVRQQTLSKGLNIVRRADGKVVKIMVK